MKVDYSPYRLQVRAGLNAKTTSDFIDGVLLRVTLDNQQIGYSALQPWPSLGDQSLHQYLEDLRGEPELALAKQAIENAHVDSKLRIAIEAPACDLRNHKLVTDLVIADFEDIEKQGFRSVKIKTGRNLSAVADQVRDKISECSLRLRFDFNSVASFADTMMFLEKLGSPIRDRIDFIEDPTPYCPEEWVKLNNEVPIALDFEVDAWAKEPIDLSVFVLKPERQSVDSIQGLDRFKKLVVTSSMGHPLGQALSAYVASQTHHPLLDCGLNSHTAFEWNSYSEIWRNTPEPSKFTFGGDIGLGWGQLLENEKWQALRD